MRLTPRARASGRGRINFWKTGFVSLKKTRKVQVKKVVRANKVAAFKTKISVHTPAVVDLQEGAQDIVINRQMFFTVKKAAQAFDFNKFLKVNTVAARAVNNLSLDLYSQYLTNLQAGTSEVMGFSAKGGSTNVQAARALRKYLRLLKRYFNEVSDRKMAKNIPASSAMHWIREYLRLTGSIKRRTPL
jgi:hypothetical protein